MKKTKLLTGVILSIAVVLLCTACSSSSNFFRSMQEATSIKSYDYLSEITLSATNLKAGGLLSATEDDNETNLKLKLSGTILENGDFSSDIFIGIDSTIDNGYIKAFQTDGEYLNLTDIIMKDDTIYINIQKLTKVLDAYGLEQYTMMLNYFDSEYIEIGLDTINKYGLAIQSDDIEKSAAITRKIYTNLIELIETAIKDIKPSLLSENRGVYTFKLNKDNLPAVIDAVINLPDNVIEEFLDESITELKAIDNEQTAQLVKELGELKEMLSSTDVKGKIIGQIDLIKEELINSIDNFEIIGTSAIKGNSGSRKWNFTLNTDYEQGESGISLEVNHNTSELAQDTEIEVPADFTSFNGLFS